MVQVNRNHLSSALRRLMLETHMPTGQQATLLRSAQVISVRYVQLAHMQILHVQSTKYRVVSVCIILDS